MDHSNEKACTCGKKYKNLSNLRRHVKNSHKNEDHMKMMKNSYIYKNKDNFKHTCKICGKNFNKLYHLRYHERKIHCDNQSEYKIDKESKNCPMCSTYKSSIKLNLIKHFEMEHNINVKENKITFSCQEEFDTWKAEFEHETLSNFVKIRTKNYESIRTIQYTCHRSESFVPTGTGKRHLKTQGSCKIGGFCPASINVKIDERGVYNVDYIETHVGHKHDIGHLHLSKNERSNLAEKISSKVPFDTILDSVRDGVSSTSLERIHLLTRKDLQNIEYTFNLRDSAIRHSNDGVSVDSWANQMLGDCVLFYKPQDTVHPEHPELQAQDFVLIIQNDSQSEILKQFGDDCVCLDGTHGTNQYDFEMHTLLVLDEMRQGIPCGFLISNRSDESVLRIFFSYIKIRTGVITPKVFMSDMAESYFSAWLAIMGRPSLRLYCSWHVDRAWRNNLTKIKTREKKIEVYKKLRTLQQETDAVAFGIITEELCTSLKTDSDTVEFAKYFETYYVKNPEQWAYCHRLYSGLNTNMHLERMHHTLKYIYLKGKKVKRLDKAVHSIMKLVRDKLFERLIILNKGKITSKIRDIRSRHKTSLQLRTDLVLKNGEGWDVLSSNKDCGFYHIEDCRSDCDCQLICSDCKICLHRFYCSCIDSSIKWNMCKHIHLLCRFIKEESNNLQQPTILASNIYTEELVIDASSDYEKLECEKILTDLSKNNTPKSEDLENKKKDLLSHLASKIGSIDSIEKYNIFKKTLDQISPTFKAIDHSKEKTILPQKQKERTASHNSRIIPQRRLFSTKNKTRKDKRKDTTTKKPTSAESTRISFLLSSTAQHNHNDEQWRLGGGRDGQPPTRYLETTEPKSFRNKTFPS